LNYIIQFKKKQKKTGSYLRDKRFDIMLYKSKLIIILLLLGLIKEIPLNIFDILNVILSSWKIFLQTYFVQTIL
jgi:hypothetical protein